MVSIQNFEENGFNVEIFYDEDPESPREWDNLGTILYMKGSRYTLGDEAVDHEDIEEITQSDKYVWLPVYAYIHSGIALNTVGFSCPWDSGQCGIIYASKDDIRKNFELKRNVTQKTIDKVYNIFKAEIETFSHWASGDVYGFAVKNSDGDVIDSCRGFYDIEYCVEEAKLSCA